MKKPSPRQLDLFAPSPSKAEGLPPASTRGNAPVERTLEDARHDLRHFQLMQLWPGQSAERLEVLQRCESTCRREIRQRWRAIKDQRTQEGAKPAAGSR